MATTSTVDLILPRDPSSSLHAVTKQYADAGDLDAERSQTYPMSEYGIVASSLHFDSVVSVSSVGVSVSTIEVYRVYVPANTLITGACCIVGGAGTTPGSTNASGFALYADDGSSRLAITTNDYTLFTSTGLKFKAFQSTVAAQSTGRFLRLAMIHSCSGTAPKFGAGTAVGSTILNSIVPSGTHRRGLFKTSTTSFPVSFDPATYSLDSPPLFLGLY